MNRSIFFMLLLLPIFSHAHEATYYLFHPEKLERVMSNCSHQSSNETCEQLKPIVIEVNGYIEEMRVSPQGFGQKILALQEKLANAQEDKQDTQELRARLAIVKWLESPQG